MSSGWLIARDLDALTALLDHLPGALRVAIASRMEPELPFARFRVQGHLLEIGPSLLALDEPETAALTEAAGFPLEPPAVRSLAARTEGWAAGIYLACLARDRGDTDAGLIGSVSGADRFIAAYLRSEIGGDLDEGDVTFLTRTSVLETFAPPVAEAVTGMAGAGDRLARLAHGNLLIQELGTPGSAYRYHNLLRDYLAAELERREPGRVSEFHRRAAVWHAANGSTESAVEHSLTGRDLEAAALYMTPVVVAVFNRGRAATVARWLAALDDPMFARHPPLAVYAAWIHLLSGRPDAAERMAEIADGVGFDGWLPDGAGSFESMRAALRAAMARHGPRRMLEDATQAVEREPPESRWRGVALVGLAYAHLLVGDGVAPEPMLEAASSRAPAAAMFSLAKQAAIRINRSDWDSAERLSKESMENLLEAHYEGLVPAILAYGVAARVAAHRGDLARAREYPRSGAARPPAGEPRGPLALGSRPARARQGIPCHLGPRRRPGRPPRSRADRPRRQACAGGPDHGSPWPSVASWPVRPRRLLGPPP